MHCNISECSKHCSLCWNETECYECTQGYYLDSSEECQSEFSIDIYNITLVCVCIFQEVCVHSLSCLFIIGT